MPPSVVALARDSVIICTVAALVLESGGLVSGSGSSSCVVNPST